mmetsp:Transcript_20316/g.64904  ORF Transcript_20316/g.64904 Transcript_20316/m.64904 type:complete len:207 (+) Transcript_20316:294-914(+)
MEEEVVPTPSIDCRICRNALYEAIKEFLSGLVRSPVHAEWIVRSWDAACVLDVFRNEASQHCVESGEVPEGRGDGYRRPAHVQDSLRHSVVGLFLQISEGLVCPFGEGRAGFRDAELLAWWEILQELIHLLRCGKNVQGVVDAGVARDWYTCTECGYRVRFNCRHPPSERRPKSAQRRGSGLQLPVIRNGAEVECGQCAHAGDVAR